MPKPSYVVVSPVKDEERYVELTLQSMTNQTLQPALWVIVDDGCRDRTVEIVKRYAARHSFIKLVHHPNAGERRPGSAVMHAFNFGHAVVGDRPYDFIVKLDCDLSFQPDYFQKLLSKFEADSSLGIASGVYLEADAAGTWTQVPMPAYHAFGACKVIRRQCWEAIGGFPAAPGWDTVDEIRAWSRGWDTCHFDELQTKHHKREGSGIGPLKTSRMHGEIYYTTGGDPLFFLFKVLHRLAARPVLVNAAALTVGYGSAVLTRKPRLVTASEARCYRRLLRRRLFARFRRPATLNAVQSGQ